MSRVEIVCKLIVAGIVVLLLCAVIQRSGLPDDAKGAIGMSIGIFFIGLDRFLEPRLSPRWRRFLSMRREERQREER